MAERVRSTHTRIQPLNASPSAQDTRQILIPRLNPRLKNWTPWDGVFLTISPRGSRNTARLRNLAQPFHFTNEETLAGGLRVAIFQLLFS
jgi:hypothetical protein